jgi:CRP-like cAMP-binding protein
MVGATRESVNKALAGLQRRGLVKRVGKRYVVSDVASLRSRAR